MCYYYESNMYNNTSIFVSVFDFSEGALVARSVLLSEMHFHNIIFNVSTSPPLNQEKWKREPKTTP